MNSLKHLLGFKIISIIRGVQPHNVLAITEALYEGGIRSVEITLNSPSALRVIENLSFKMGDKMLIGAGTVLGGEEAVDAVNAGARFIISPIVNKEVIDVAKQRGVVSIPGAFTATEIHQAVVYGADIIKIFPASVGPQYIRDLRGPFPHIPLMPTGGVDLDNIAAFSRAGAAAFGVGSALVKANKDLDNDYITSLTAKAKQFVTAISIEGEPGK